MVRLFLPSFPYAIDAIFRQMVADSLGRTMITESFIDLTEPELKTLREKLSPDLLIQGLSKYNPDWTRYSVSCSKVTELYKDKKPKFPPIFSTEALSGIGKDLENPNSYYSDFREFLGKIIDQMQIKSNGNGLRCDECGTHFEFFANGRPRTPPIFKKVWPTLNKYTPGRLRFALSETDPDTIRSKMGNSYLNLLCPTCVWREIIEQVVIHGFKDPEKHFLILLEMIAEKDENIERLAINLAHRLSTPPAYSKGTEMPFYEDETELEDLIDELPSDSYKIIAANGKVFLVIEPNGLILNYRTKNQRRKIKMNGYVDPDLRLKKEAHLLYSLVLQAIRSVTLNGEPLGRKIKLYNAEDNGLKMVDTSKAVDVFRLMLFAEEKLGSSYPFLRSEGKLARPLLRWRQITRFLTNPISEFGKSIRYTYGKNNDLRSKKDLNKKPKKDFNELIEKYYELVKPIMPSNSNELEFVQQFTEFLYGLPVAKPNSSLAKWKEITANRQESSYENPLREFFRIFRKQPTIEQGIAEFMTKLSRQGMDISKLDFSKVDEFEEYCKKMLPKINERNAINISMFVIYRTLQNLAGEQNEK
ncbi:MAG: hypothetical protein D6732_06695 [Methanobacteriota archaeon]|nr:MAG: hypothetical protein D6732_06695 [Euryarchaeota archaeon]